MSRTKKSAPADKEHAVTNQTAAKVAIAPLRVEGDMTIYQAAELKQTLLASLATTSPLVLDLSAVSEIDTSGVQLLMMAAQYARACGQEFRLTRPSQSVIEVIELLHLESYFGDWATAPSLTETAA